MVYCFYPWSVAAGAVGRFVLRCPVVLDLEDVSVPRLEDWKQGTRARPVQQLSGWMGMKALLALSDAVVVPTKRFLRFVPTGKRVEVVSGCMDARPLAHEGECGVLHVLFAGKVEREHGSAVLAEALKALDASPAGPRFRFDVCGGGKGLEELRAAAGALAHVSVAVHGFVDDIEYRRLLARADIALAIQDPSGRYSDLKTPSKAYEFMASGKAVVVSDVGDLAELPNETRHLLTPYSGEALAGLLASMTADSVVETGAAALRHAKNHWGIGENGRKILALFRRALETR
ncbi:MAG: glycosyltransferase [Myxococcales bacterium]